MMQSFLRKILIFQLFSFGTEEEMWLENQFQHIKAGVIKLDDWDVKACTFTVLGRKMPKNFLRNISMALIQKLSLILMNIPEFQMVQLDYQGTLLERNSKIAKEILSGKIYIVHNRCIFV